MAPTRLVRVGGIVTIDMRSLRVDYSTALKAERGLRAHEAGSTIFVPLPRGAWQPLDRCDCANCKGRPAFWDTLAIQRRPDEGQETSRTWLVHRPERHPFHDVEGRTLTEAMRDGLGFYTDPEKVPCTHASFRDRLEAEHENQRAERANAQANQEGSDSGR